MDPMDTYAVLTVVCGFLAMMLYEAGMFFVPTVLCAIGVVCVILAYCSCASGRRRRKRKRR